MADKKIENIIKGRLEKFETDAPVDSWEAIEAAMGDVEKTPFYKKAWIVIPALIMFIGGVILIPWLPGYYVDQEGIVPNTEIVENGSKTDISVSPENESTLSVDNKNENNSQDTSAPIDNIKSSELQSSVEITETINNNEGSEKISAVDYRSNEENSAELNISAESAELKVIEESSIQNQLDKEVSVDSRRNVEQAFRLNSQSKGDKEKPSEKPIGSNSDIDIKGVKTQSSKTLAKDVESLQVEKVATLDVSKETKTVPSTSAKQLNNHADQSFDRKVKNDLSIDQVTKNNSNKEIAVGSIDKNHRDNAQISSVNQQEVIIQKVNDEKGKVEVLSRQKDKSFISLSNAQRADNKIGTKLTALGYEVLAYSSPDIQLNFHIITDSSSLTGTKKDETDQEKSKDFGPWSAYFYGMPTFSYHRIETNNNDDILINSVEKISPFSLDRLGFRIEGGIQRAISEKWNVSLGILYWHSNQEFRYNISQVDSIVTEPIALTNSLVLTPQLSEQQETYKFTLRNLGLHVGASFNLSSKRVVQQLGGGIEIHKALNQPDVDELMLEEPDYYMFYNMFYRMEYPRDKPLRFLFQPTFNYSLPLDKRLDAPFYVKPYGFGLNFGFVYRF